MKKFRLLEMSWIEAEEAFKKSDTVMMAVGTLHAHGPTPIGIDAISVDKLADEVGKRTGMMILPLLPYGENDKMRDYPGSLAISQHVMEAFCTDICRSLRRNGVRKVIFLNGHGGNRDPLIRTGRNVRKLGMLISIVEWWTVERKLMPELFPEGSHISELALAVAIDGPEVADIRSGGYKGEWGKNPPLKPILGAKIKPLGFNNFEFGGAQLLVPVDAWDIDIASPPEIRPADLDGLRKRGEEAIARLTDYLVEFAKEFEKVDMSKALPPS
ncbi:MAG TPA: creatininase family protein [bacterium]|nr:creatininase family protein [bacterium]